MKKVTLELDKKLVDGELLIYKNGVVKSIEIHELLPELLVIDNSIRDLSKLENKDHQEINELKARDLFIAKSLYDNYVERGLIDENEEFDEKFYNFIFSEYELKEEDLDDDFKKILEKVRA